MSAGVLPFLAALALLGSVARATAAAPEFVTLDTPSAASGYVARLLINENPFPGERGYTSVADSKAGMVQVLWVLHGRMHYIPAGYTQSQIAYVRSRDVLEVITARNQCEGFFRDAQGQPSFAPRVEERVRYLTKIANSGGQPGKFAELLNFGQGLARAYLHGGIEEVDRFAGIAEVNRVAVTGRAYSWMTNLDCYNPGGNYVAIPDSQGGSPGGNRFFTLRREPK